MSWMSRELGGWIVGVLVGVVLVASCGMGAAAERSVLMKRFDTLKANSMAAVANGKVETVEAAVVAGGQKIRLVGQAQIAPAPPMIPAGPPLRLGVKICGQLLNGQFVNLTKHKWQRSEQFYLWLETAVPIQLAFFQNYPEGRPPSRQVSPDQRFPSTFATIMPGVPYRFPVLIQMDDDLRDEQVSIVVVRADAQVLPINGATMVSGSAVATASATAVASAIVETQTGVMASAHATATAVGPGGAAAQAQAQAAAGAGGAAAQAQAQAAAGPGGAQASAFAAALGGVVGPGGTLKSAAATQTKSIMAALNNYARFQPKSKSTRMKLSLVAPPPPMAPPISATYGDVEILLMGPGNIAQIELTFHKD